MHCQNICSENDHLHGLPACLRVPRPLPQHVVAVQAPEGHSRLQAVVLRQVLPCFLRRHCVLHSCLVAQLLTVEQQAPAHWAAAARGGAVTPRARAHLFVVPVGQARPVEQLAAGLHAEDGVWRQAWHVVGTRVALGQVSFLVGLQPADGLQQLLCSPTSPHMHSAVCWDHMHGSSMRKARTTCCAMAAAA